MPEESFQNIEQDIVQTIASVTGRKLEEFKPEANFYDDLGIDSIKAIEIVVAIERKYKIRIRDEQVPRMSTVAQAIEAVKAALKKKQDEEK
ncbi:MAG: acyl carrier protein [Candidatus Omnitrophica bacterium]|nr:acyl carrier protein [Candidatus Omnitrophota bacterium]